MRLAYFFVNYITVTIFATFCTFLCQLFPLTAKHICLDEQDLQDELEDLTEQSGELQEVMGRSYGMPDVDDDELEAELNALGDEIALDDDTSYLDEAVRAPDAPTTVPSADRVPARVRLILCLIFHMSSLGTRPMYKNYHLASFSYW